MTKIRFNFPYTTGREFDYMQQAVSNRHLSGDGEFTKRCHRFLEDTLGIPKALLTTSCTHALEMSALLLDIQPGDEVIVPSFTFVTTINAFVLRGATPIFADIRADTLNIDESQLEALITERTKAILVVHYAGVACEMNTIMAIAHRHQIKVVEDNAHGLLGKYHGQYLGSFGAMATQSFHETKNFQCGEGGALLINDRDFVERAEIIREKGTNRSQFFRGQIDKYTWVDIGSSYLPSDLLAAFLWAQFEAYVDIQTRRQRIWEYYDAQLSPWAEKSEVRQPFVPEYCEQTYHMYYLLMPSLDQRTRFIDHLKAQGISAVFHYLPLNASIMGQQLGGQVGQCPVTEDLSDRLVRLPLYNTLNQEEQDFIIDAIHNFAD